MVCRIVQQQCKSVSDGAKDESMTMRQLITVWRRAVRASIKDKTRQFAMASPVASGPGGEVGSHRTHVLPPTVAPTFKSLSVVDCEHLIVQLLLSDYLQEQFHHTMYVCLVHTCKLAHPHC